jgi:sulfotransferase
MEKTFYFISGLPRSGSSVLSAILNQNPRFYSGPSSPVVATMLSLENSLANDELFLANPKIEQGKQIIASVLPQYYSDMSEPVIFDKNRSWTVRMEYIEGYFDIKPKIICPVRDISEILASFIQMYRRNPYQVNGKINFMDEMLVKNNIPLTDDNRCEMLASSNGILRQSVEALKKALMEGYDGNIHLVEYNDLINNPKETMDKIYQFLGEEPFEHTFDKLKNENSENDAQVYGFADMHEVRPVLKSVSKRPEDVLSLQIIEKCKGTEFWRVLLSEDEEEYNYTVNDDNGEENESQLIGVN